MSWTRFLQRARRDRDFAHEMESYLEHETRDNVARGMSAAEARAAARRKFGNTASAQEAIHERNGVPVLDALSQNVRYAARQLRQNPGFTAAAVLSLALGIGANTAIFTLFDQVMLRLLPVPEPRQLVKLKVAGGRFGANNGSGLHSFSYPAYLALRDTNTVFSGLAGERLESLSLIDEGPGELIPAAFTSGNYFDVLGVRAHRGRVLAAGDNEGSGNQVAVLQYDYWRTRFESREDVVGRSVRLNGVPYHVIGIAAPEFQGTDPVMPVRMWLPVVTRRVVSPASPRLDNERYSWFYLLGRLAPGISIAQAETAMRVTYRQLQEQELKMPYFSRFPQSRERFLRQQFGLDPAGNGDSFVRFSFERPLVILQWLVAAVLLIACANVAGLLIARGAARQREIGVRAAIGAGRGRIIVQLLTESLMLAFAGGAAGLLVGAWLARLILRLLPVDQASMSLSASPDPRVLFYAIVVTLLTTVVFGLAPAFQASRVSPSLAMREGAGAVSGGHSTVRLRKLFVAVQVVLSTVLLAGAGLFARTLHNLRSVDLGLRSDSVVTFSVRPATQYDAQRKTAMIRSLMESLATVPGVRAVGANTQRLFTGGRSDGGVVIPGFVQKGPDGPDAYFNEVTPGYFAALGIPVKHGRDFEWRDWGSGRKVALVNETAVRELFDASAPVGRMVGRGGAAPVDTEIIGVFGDARYDDVRGAIPRQLFTSLDSHVGTASTFMVYARVAGAPNLAMPVLRQRTIQVDPNLVVADMGTLDGQVGQRIARERLVALLSTAFAVLAVALAMVGLYGVLAFIVARRTREIGLRIALGAGRDAVIRIIAGEMGMSVCVSLVAGLGAAYAAAEGVRSLLFGVEPLDPAVLIGSPLVLLAASAAAALLPAWRAARIDPAKALRPE